MSGAAAVEMSGVIALLGGFPALSGLDLTVARGEVVLVAGPNGAGMPLLKLRATPCALTIASPSPPSNFAAATVAPNTPTTPVG